MYELFTGQFAEDIVCELYDNYFPSTGWLVLSSFTHHFKKDIVYGELHTVRQLQYCLSTGTSGLSTQYLELHTFISVLIYKRSKFYFKF